ncbi:DNA polymerase alpha catalytic subunit isoform X2 [Phlebotomus papatasi]|uniref:DNA polymerase alpha catalytic subunit isoform X2 n=1 Tax=Phlebotomus papatasi TaxID=29031 RepID=UPI002483487B|nr:DNA polymerase alpha catalytic subunit isoform X2 [Phlebotomus papatasi]
MGDSAEPRSKRQKIDKHGRFAALQRLKEIKSSGTKHKYELSEEVDNVYDTVDEREYSKRVQTRAAEDWIDDDDGEYVEDGREIFDDEDSDGESVSTAKNKKESKKRGRENTKPAKGKNSIRNLFSNAVPKKASTVTLGEDSILSEILGEIDGSQDKAKDTTSTVAVKKPSVTKQSEDNAALVKEYMQSFSKNIKRKEVPKEEGGSDDELLDRIANQTMASKNPSKETLVHSKEVHLNGKEDRKEDSEVEKVNEEVKNCSEPEKKNEVTEFAVPEQKNEAKGSSESERKSHEQEKTEENLADLLNTEDFAMDFDISVPNVAAEPRNHAKEKIQAISTEKITTNWEAIAQMNNDNDIDFTAFDMADFASESEKKIWFWDAWEDPVKRPGQLFLFGRVQVENSKENYKSVTVHIQSVNKRLFLLPRQYLLDKVTREETRDKVTLGHVMQEFQEVLQELKIESFQSKQVTKNFAFSIKGVKIPQSSECIEVRYSGHLKAPLNTSKKYYSIAHIFGTSTTPLETFLLDSKIKGPCWLTIKHFQIRERPLTWSRVEMVVANSKSVCVAPEKNQNPPPLSLMTLNVRSNLNMKTTKNEIVMISCLIQDRFPLDKPPPNPAFNRHLCGLTHPSHQGWPMDFAGKFKGYNKTKAKKFESERELLSWFLAIYQNTDPDLIVTHDAADCQLDVIFERIITLKIPNWSRIGRLRKTVVDSKRHQDNFTGRMICDVKKSAEELIKSRSYDLGTLCTEVLKIQEEDRIEISNDDIHFMYESSDEILKLITLTMQDASYVLRLMCELNVLPLALQITNVCGNMMARTLQGGRSERNEYLLLHAFNERDYIVPDKKERLIGKEWDKQENAEQGQGRKKAAYAGGLVLEPIKGFYEKFILLMDFNSLYPSIIQEYNICYTTIDEPLHVEDHIQLPDSSVEQGVLPKQIRRLVESRREVKKLMANPDLDPELKMQYNIRQMALKLTANSMYGCLGFSHSRFYAPHLAALITRKGRDILMDTKNLATKLNLEVIYGDTDSIMINTNCVDYEQVFKIGLTVKQKVNRMYKNVELDIDGVFKFLLLLKKKKYAALTVSKGKNGELKYNQELKGLDIVRRDWSKLSVMVGRAIIEDIFSPAEADDKIEKIHDRLESIRRDIMEQKVPLPLFVITKQLTKPPKEYASNSNLPHVIVALRMNNTQNRRFKKGDTVSYVICQDGTDKSHMQRAYHLDELQLNPDLKIDAEYYLTQQIFPVISRLCEPLDGTNISRLAQCLGLDAKKYRSMEEKMDREDELNDDVNTLVKTSAQKYHFCEKFSFKCVSCHQENPMAAAVKRVDANLVPVLAACVNPDCKIPPYEYLAGIQNQLIMKLRTFLDRFYENWMVCDDNVCSHNTRIITHVLSSNDRPVCCACGNGNLVRQYSETDLYTQIRYFQYIFDLTQPQYKKMKIAPQVEDAYQVLKETVDRFLGRSAYCIVNLGTIFSKLHLVKPSEERQDVQLN